MRYIWIFIWIFILNLFYKRVAPEDSIYYDSFDEFGYRRMIPLFLAISAFIPILIIAVFGEARNDVPFYTMAFKAMPSTIEDAKVYIRANDEGKLFAAFSILIKMLFGYDKTIYRFSIFLFHAIPVMYLFRKYSQDYFLSLYLFCAAAMPIAWMMNGLRQFMAAGIILLATPLLENKKYIKLFIVILIASLIHQTAIVMIPLLLIADGKAFNKRTLFFILCAVVVFWAFLHNRGLFDTVLVTAGYDPSNYAADTGSNLYRLLVSCVPVILAVYCRREILESGDFIINLSVNMSIVTALLYLVAMVTSGITIGRLPGYTATYSFVLYPYLFKMGLREPSSSLIKFGCIVFYFLFWYLQYGQAY